MHHPTRSGKDALRSFSLLVSFLLLVGPVQAEIDSRTEMPTGLMEAFQQARHRIEASDSGEFRAGNPGNKQRFQFLPTHFEVSSNNPDQHWTWGLSLSAYGTENRLDKVSSAILSVEGQRIEYQRGDITEWYINHPEGLEQGFTLTGPPGIDQEQLVIKLDITGNLLASWLEEGQSIAFHQTDGTYALTYQKLVAFDANEYKLPAHMQLVDGSIQLHVDATDAAWPVTVDPLVVNEQKVIAIVSDLEDDLFGEAVDIDGDTAVVGARYDSCAGGECGAAYIFVRSGTGWTQQAKLVASDGANGDRFGSAAAMDGDYVVIGANADRHTLGACASGLFCGSVYVFQRTGSTWSEKVKLAGSDTAANDLFGAKVAISGNTFLASAIFDNTPNGNSGSVYVFTGSGAVWNEQQKIFPVGLDANSEFGTALEIDGDTALIGAYKDDLPAGAQAGSAFVFTRSGVTWTQEAMLTASDGAADDNFGLDAALSGDTAILGARLDDCGAGSDCGSAYVFTRTGTVWSPQAKLTAFDESANAQFGRGMALVGDTAIIGAWNEVCDAGALCGAAYVFKRDGTTWEEIEKIAPGDVTTGDTFGFRVRFDGETAIMGSHGSGCSAGSDCGSAYIFNVNDYDQWNQQAKLLPVKSDITADDFFGESVAVSGDTAVIGIPLDDQAAIDAGAAYVLTRIGNSWNFQAKLLPSITAVQGQFGASVDVYGDTVLIGAPFGDKAGTTSSGAAEVFLRSGSTWASQAQLFATDAQSSDKFGQSVSLSEDKALIGADFERPGGLVSAGSAYVFARDGTTWAQQAKLNSSDIATGDQFGHSVSLSGDYALVGAFSNDDNGGGSGSAYVFFYNGTTWGEQAKLLASDAASLDLFGEAVSLDGDTAIIGAQNNDDVNPDSGSAYIFTRSGTLWTEQQKLTASDAQSNNFFGHSVAVHVDTALVGAHKAFGGASGSGSAYAFTRTGTTWTQRKEIYAFDGASADEFGASVALSDDTALVGSNRDGNDFGSAYFFTFPCSFRRVIPDDKWYMVAPPCTPDPAGELADVWGDDIGGAYETDWIVYERDTDNDVYAVVEWDDAVDPGKGMWLRTFNPGVLQVVGTPTPMLGSPECPSDNGCFDLGLTTTATGPLAHMIGVPLPYGVDWKDVIIVIDGDTVHSISSAHANNYIDKTYHLWNGNAYDAYDDTTPGMEGTLKPYTSIFIKVKDGSDGFDMKIMVPAKPSVKTGKLDQDLPWYAHVINWLIPSAHAEPPDHAKGKEAQKEHLKLHANANKGGGKGGGSNESTDWYVRLTVTQPILGLVDRNSVFGQLSDSIAGYDDHDLVELAPFGDTYLTLVFPHQDWGDKAANYASDFHSFPAKKQDGDNWEFEVQSDDPGRVLILTWGGPPDVLERSTLIDQQTGIEVSASIREYQFDMDGGTRSFEWVLAPVAGKGKKK